MNRCQPFLTTYNPSPALTPTKDYDFNFVFPFKVLRSDRVELKPVVVDPSRLSNNRAHYWTDLAESTCASYMGWSPSQS